MQTCKYNTINITTFDRAELRRETVPCRDNSVVLSKVLEKLVKSNQQPRPVAKKTLQKPIQNILEGLIFVLLQQVWTPDTETSWVVWTKMLQSLGAWARTGAEIQNHVSRNAQLKDFSKHEIAIQENWPNFDEPIRFEPGTYELSKEAAMFVCTGSLPKTIFDMMIPSRLSNSFRGTSVLYGSCNVGNNTRNSTESKHERKLFAKLTKNDKNRRKTKIVHQTYALSPPCNPKEFSLRSARQHGNALRGWQFHKLVYIKSSFKSVLRTWAKQRLIQQKLP